MICVAIVEWFSLSRSLIVIGSLLCKTTNIYNTKHLTFRSMSGLACIAFQGIKSKYSTGIWRIYQIHQLYGCKQLKLVIRNEWKEVKKKHTQTNTYTHTHMHAGRQKYSLSLTNANRAIDNDDYSSGSSRSSNEKRRWRRQRQHQRLRQRQQQHQHINSEK